MPYCPHCHMEIDHLQYEANYSEYGHEYGNCNTDGEDQECEDRSSDDGETCDEVFRCPECEGTVTPGELDDNPDGEDDDENDENLELEQDYDPDNEEFTDGGEEVVRPSNDHIIAKPQKALAKSIECPECHQINFRELNESCICSNCNFEIE